MMTKEQRIEKAERIISAALKAIEEAAADAATMRDHLPKYSSCYTMQELDRIQKDCDKAEIKCNALSALYHDMSENRESVKTLDFAVIWLWFPKVRTALIRHICAHMKKTGEAIESWKLNNWLLEGKRGDWMTADYYTGIRSDYKSAYTTLTVKREA